MDRNSLSARARELATQIGDNHLLGRVEWVLDRPEQKVRGLNQLLVELRKFTITNRNHQNSSHLLFGELGCVLGELYYEHIAPQNPYILSSYTSMLNVADRPQLVINLITKYLQNKIIHQNS